METTVNPRKSLLKRALKWFGALILIGAVAFAGTVYWYFYNIGTPTGPEFVLDMNALRTAADDVAG